MTPRFHETIESWGDELPDDWREQINSAYDEDFSGAIEKNNQLSTQLEEISANSAAEIAKLKAANYDLMMSVPSDDTGIVDEASAIDDGDSDITIDELFGKDED